MLIEKNVTAPQLCFYIWKIKKKTTLFLVSFFLFLHFAKTLFAFSFYSALNRGEAIHFDLPRLWNPSRRTLKSNLYFLVFGPGSVGGSLESTDLSLAGSAFTTGGKSGIFCCNNDSRLRTLFGHLWDQCALPQCRHRISFRGVRGLLTFGLEALACGTPPTSFIDKSRMDLRPRGVCGKVFANLGSHSTFTLGILSDVMFRSGTPFSWPWHSPNFGNLRRLWTLFSNVLGVLGVLSDFSGSLSTIFFKAWTLTLEKLDSVSIIDEPIMSKLSHETWCCSRDGWIPTVGDRIAIY